MKERCIVPLDNCKRYRGWAYCVVDVSSNPLISYITNTSSRTNFSVHSLNYMNPYESGVTVNGITITKENDGSYHITGTASANGSRELFRPDAGGLPQAPMKLDYYVQTDGNYSDFTWQTAGGTALQGTYPQPEATDYEVRSAGTNVLTRTLLFNYTKNTQYDFYVKAWSTPNRDNPTGTFYPYFAKTSIGSPTLGYDLSGYNFVFPVTNQKVVVCANGAKNSGIPYAGFELYYDPDYVFDYHKHSDIVERLGLPLQLRPFTGVASSTTLSRGSGQYGWKVPLPKQYPVRGIRYICCNSANLVVVNHSANTVMWNTRVLFDQNMNAIKSINDAQGYVEVYYGTSEPSAASATMVYEWILGDPPIDYTT